jgi:cyclomaltodextrinase
MGMWGADDPNPRKPLIWPDLQFETERAHPLGLPRPADEVAFNADLFDYYRQLIRIRKENPVLATGDIEFIVADDANQTLAYRRFNDKGQQVVAVFNANTTAQTVTIAGSFAGAYQDLLGNATVDSKSDQLQVVLPGRRAAIISVE